MSYNNNKKKIVKKKWKRFKKIEPINWKKNHESYAPWEFKKGGGRGEKQGVMDTWFEDDN